MDQLIPRQIRSASQSSRLWLQSAHGRPQVGCGCHGVELDVRFPSSNWISRGYRSLRHMLGIPSSLQANHIKSQTRIDHGILPCFSVPLLAIYFGTADSPHKNGTLPPTLPWHLWEGTWKIGFLLDHFLVRCHGNVAQMVPPPPLSPRHERGYAGEDLVAGMDAAERRQVLGRVGEGGLLALTGCRTACRFFWYLLCGGTKTQRKVV